MTKEKATMNYTTGKVTVTGFAAVSKPSIKFNKNGLYQINVILSKDEGETLTQKLLELRKNQFKQYGKGMPVKDIQCLKPLVTVDNETGEEIPDSEGRYLLKTKAKAWVENGVPQNKILVVDAKRKPIKYISIGEGSIVKLFISFEGYSTAALGTSVTTNLKAVQVINLVEYGGTSISATGFTDEEGFKFDAEETKEYEPATEEEASEEDF